MNRVLQYLGKSCECQRHRRTLDRFVAAAKDIEMIIGTDVVEMCVPTMTGLQRGDEPQLEICLRHEPAACTDPSVARDHVGLELLLLSGLLADAAAKLEAGAE